MASRSRSQRNETVVRCHGHDANLSLFGAFLTFDANQRRLAEAEGLTVTV
jgi:hypothetical protein